MQRTPLKCYHYEKLKEYNMNPEETDGFICFPYQSYCNALRQNIAFLNKIGLELSKKLIKTTMNCKSAALYSAKTRLCICLLEASEGNMIRILLTELASAAGTSYRHMQRIMRQLCDSNILRKDRNGYQILDRRYILEKLPKNYVYG